MLHLVSVTISYERRRLMPSLQDSDFIKLNSLTSCLFKSCKNSDLLVVKCTNLKANLRTKGHLAYLWRGKLYQCTSYYLVLVVIVRHHFLYYDTCEDGSTGICVYSFIVTLSEDIYVLFIHIGISSLLSLLSFDCNLQQNVQLQLLKVLVFWKCGRYLW